MKPNQKPTPCGDCGHSAWIHREAKTHPGNPLGLDRCARPGCDCSRYADSDA